MSADERIKVTFRRVHILRDADDVGSGDWYFIATVDGRPVGDRNRIFDAEEGRSIPLPERQWEITINVTGRNLNSNPVIVRFQVKDSDIISDEDLGTIERRLHRNVSQGNFTTHRDPNRYFILDYTVELSVLGRFGFHPPGAVFATRQNRGNVSCTTVSGGSFMARMEICPVCPVPADINNPPRPRIAPALAAVPPERNRVDGIIVQPNDPINVIPNPSAIPVLDPADANANTAARIEFTYYHPNTLGFTVDDPRLEWSAVPISGGAVQFLPPARGRRVLVYGTAEGEVRLEMRFQGALFATYRALVRPVRQILYRTNILNGPPRSQPRSRPEHVRDHIAIANRFLRQMAIELVPDPDNTVTDGAEPTGIQGIFRIRVAQGVTRNIPTDGWSRATRLNYRQGVFNFAYIHSDRDNNRGAADDYPASRAGATIRDNGTPSTSWIQPSGIPPDGAAGDVIMNLLPARERQRPYRVFPGLFSMFVTNECGGPDELRDQQEYAGTIAHELGHVMNLDHRAVGGPDGLNRPTDENVMHPRNNTDLAQDFDIIQTRAVHQSPLVRP